MDGVRSCYYITPCSIDGNTSDSLPGRKGGLRIGAETPVVDASASSFDSRSTFLGIRTVRSCGSVRLVSALSHGNFLPISVD